MKMLITIAVINLLVLTVRIETSTIIPATPTKTPITTTATIPAPTTKSLKAAATIPASTTKAPITRAAPATSTKAPITRTATIRATSTKAPITRAGPAASTKAPVSRAGPGASTKAPITRASTIPATSTNAPVTSAATIPATTTKAPITTTATIPAATRTIATSLKAATPIPTTTTTIPALTTKDPVTRAATMPASTTKAQMTTSRTIPVSTTKGPITRAAPATSTKAPITGTIPASSTKAPITRTAPATFTKAPITGTIPASTTKAPITGTAPATSTQAPITGTAPATSTKAPITGTAPATSTKAPMTGTAAASTTPQPSTTTTIPTTTTTIPAPLQIRLVGGSGPMEGRIEVFHNYTWGTVCHDGWDHTDASVVCRQLGFSPVGAVALYAAAFGEGTGDIWLANVHCSFNDMTLGDCYIDGWGEDHWGMRDCNHTKDASVRCKAVELVGGSEVTEGRVEVWHNGTYRPVCRDGFGPEEAQAVCRYLGFTSNKVVDPDVNVDFGNGSGPVLVSNITCKGTESSLTDCKDPEFQFGECSDTLDASVVCNFIPVRLVNGAGPHEGRVEVFHDREWRTVCDSYWDDNDGASVVCRQLGYSGTGAISKVGAYFGEGTGNKLVVDCNGKENNWTDCRHFPGSTYCEHNEDVSVICKAIDTSVPKLANISTLMDLAVSFDLVDLDDDGLVEYADIRDHFVRIDMNGDGELSQAELRGDSVYEVISSLDAASVIGFNVDGKVTMADIDLAYLEIGREYGNELDLGEYVEYCLSKTESEESGITPKAFVRARRNYLVMDIDDNLKVTEQEFRSEFRKADYDKNGHLTPKEYVGFRPIRNVNVFAYCNDGSIGCPVESFLIMFNDADTDKDKFLTMTEYLTKFGGLTAST